MKVCIPVALWLLAGGALSCIWCTQAALNRVGLRGYRPRPVRTWSELPLPPSRAERRAAVEAFLAAPAGRATAACTATCGEDWGNMTFNDKVACRAAHDERPIWPLVVDKAYAKEFFDQVGVFTPRVHFAAHVAPEVLLDPVWPGADLWSFLRRYPVSRTVSAQEHRAREAAAAAVCSEARATVGALLRGGQPFAMKGTSVNVLLVGADGRALGFKRMLHPRRRELLYYLETRLEDWGPGGPVDWWLEADIPVGTPVTEALAERVCRGWLVQRYSLADRERGYRPLLPGLLIEELLVSEAKPAEEFKCFSFHGATEYVAHITDRFGGKTDTFYRYNGTWSRLSNVSFAATTPDRSPFDPAGAHRELAAALEEARLACNRVSKPFDFARVDFIHTDRLAIGELTPTPGGRGYPWHGSPDMNSLLGAQWQDAFC